MTIKKLRKIDIIIIAATVIVFVIIIAANASLVIRSMRNQTEQIGQTQISNIKTDFENYIANAENSLIRVASGAEQLMKESSRKALENKPQSLDIRRLTASGRYFLAARTTVVALTAQVTGAPSLRASLSALGTVMVEVISRPPQSTSTSTATCPRTTLATLPA